MRVLTQEIKDEAIKLLKDTTINTNSKADMLKHLLNNVPTNLRYGNSRYNSKIQEWFDPMGDRQHKLTTKEKAILAFTDPQKVSPLAYWGNFKYYIDIKLGEELEKKHSDNTLRLTYYDKLTTENDIDLDLGRVLKKNAKSGVYHRVYHALSSSHYALIDVNKALIDENKKKKQKLNQQTIKFHLNID